MKPSGLGGLLLPPGKSLDQGNSLKKVFGSRAAGGWGHKGAMGMRGRGGEAGGGFGGLMH